VKREATEESETTANTMKHLFDLAIEYQELLKQLPPDVAYKPSYRQQRRELIRKKFNLTDSYNYQQRL